MVEKEAALVTYNTKRERFDSVYERNKFYRGLFGYTQTVKKNGKKYKYEKDGLLDEIPNARIDDSVVILAKENVERLENYFLEWKGKVSHHVFTIILEDENIIEKINTKVKSND